MVSLRFLGRVRFSGSDHFSSEDCRHETCKHRLLSVGLICQGFSKSPLYVLILLSQRVWEWNHRVVTDIEDEPHAPYQVHHRDAHECGTVLNWSTEPARREARATALWCNYTDCCHDTSDQDVKFYPACKAQLANCQASKWR